MKIRVLRAFVYGVGDPVQAGTIIDVSDAFGKEMIGCNKAEAVDPVPPAEPLSTSNAGAVVSGKQETKK